MGNQPESKLSREIMNALRVNKAFVWKNHGGPMVMGGLPDIAGVYRGYFIGLETKMPGGTVSAIQSLRHQQIREAGGHIAVVHSVAEALELIHGIQRVAGSDISPHA